MSKKQPTSRSTGGKGEKGRVKELHPQDLQAREKDNVGAIARTERKPSLASKAPASPQPPEPQVKHEAGGRQSLRLTQTHIRHDSGVHTSSPYPESLPAEPFAADQANSKHEVPSRTSRPTGLLHAQHSSNFAKSAASETGFPPQEVPFDSNLSELSGEFAKIRSGDHERCYLFIKKYPKILNEDHQKFVLDAHHALVAGKHSYADCCVQRAIILQECKNSDHEEIKSYFEGLIHQKTIQDRFLRDLSDALAKLKARLQVSSGQPTAGPSALLETGQGTLSLQPTTDRHKKEKKYFGSVPVQPPRSHLERSDRRNSTSAYGQPAALLHDRRRSDGPTEVGPDGRPEVLNAEFKVRTESSKFFTLGRVFATPWHQSLGDGQQNNTTNDWITLDRFQQPILTHIQRMAVVKEGHGFCWCVPINTYNGKGVSKTGFSSSDRLAHAVVYMEGSPPTTTAEHGMNKRAIAVGPAGLDRKLDMMSRVNFGKVHTIEHNVKVMSVGNIRGESLADFEAYWKAAADEPKRMRNR